MSSATAERERLEAALAQVAGERVAHLATASTDLRPHVVPLCFVVIGDAVYSIIDDKPKKTHRGVRRLRNIEANPRVCIIADHYEEDWTKLWFVMLEGEASIVRDSAEYRRARVAMRSKYPQYLTMELTESVNPMIRIRVQRVVTWKGSGA